MMFNQPTQAVPNQPMPNTWQNTNQNSFTPTAWNPQQMQTQQYVPNWNRPVMTNQMPIQNQQVSGTLPGKVITNLQEVRPNEVPMDGSASIFPMNDLSSIYVKAWGPDGNIQTLKFIPDVTTNKEVAQGPTEFEKIMSELDVIKAKLADITNIPTRQQKSSYSSQKKEVVNNGE